jgi:hypothetical protein
MVSGCALTVSIFAKRVSMSDFGFLDILAENYNKAIAMLLALALSLGLGILLSLQLLMATVNQTTLELGFEM